MSHPLSEKFKINGPEVTYTNPDNQVWTNLFLD